MESKVIALVDCNSFYCSCERLFRPDLKAQPIIVLSNNDGCVISRTDEAKALGIKVGGPFFKIKDFCKKNNVHVFSSNFSLYTNISDRVMYTLKKMAPAIEVYSVDEAFIDLSGIKNPLGHGREIREIILKEVGIPVGVGIGQSKVIAKAANRLAKKSKIANGVVDLLRPDHLQYGLKKILIEDVWGIGRAQSAKMKSLGIKDAWALREYKNEALILKIFTKVGLQIKHELQGQNCFIFNKAYEPKKEIMCSRTFGQSISTLSDLKMAMASYVSNAAEKLRAQDSLCQQIAIFARTNPFNNSEQFYLFDSKTLVTPSADTLRLIEFTFELLEKNYRPGFEYKKAGVRLMNFYHKKLYQMDLFGEGDNPRSEQLMATMDLINYKEGPQSIKSAACGVNDAAFKMNRNFKSPRYTTSWNELPKF